MRTPNLDHNIIKKISEKINLRFTDEKENDNTTFSPIDIMDYIYGILHSPMYRKKYAEFLKIDFPKIPYPKDQDYFNKIKQLGKEIRLLHLMEHPILEKKYNSILFPIKGSCIIERKYIKLIGKKVYINEHQYFDNIENVAWEFYVGGYQPAQKWLKDRNERKLTIEDSKHYQKTIIALTETHKIMQEIDKIIKL